MKLLKLRALFAILVAVAIVLAVVTGQAPALARADATPPFIRVLALGDSFTAGLGGGSYFGDDHCARSPQSWAQQWVNRAESRGVDVAFENKACLGGVMADLFDQDASPDPRVSAYFVGGRAERNLSTAEARWWDGMRWVSGPRDAALWTRWKSRHWILAADVQAVFYQDVVK